MVTLTLGEAAKASGRSKATISKAIKSGRLSAEKRDDGAFQIDPAELHRVFPAETSRSRSKPEVNGVNDQVNSDLSREVGKLQAELTAAQKNEDLLKELVDDLRVQRDKWQQQAERLLLERPKDQDDKVGDELKRIITDGEKQLKILQQEQERRAARASQKPVGWLGRMLGRG